MEEEQNLTISQIIQNHNNQILASNANARRKHPNFPGTGKVPRRCRFNRRMFKEEISFTSFKKLARRAGVKRVSQQLYPELNSILRDFLRRILEKTIIYTSHSRKNTVSVLDVANGLKKNGITYYGF